MSQLSSLIRNEDHHLLKWRRVARVDRYISQGATGQDEVLPVPSDLLEWGSSKCAFAWCRHILFCRKNPGMDGGALFLRWILLHEEHGQAVGFARGTHRQEGRTDFLFFNRFKENHPNHSTPPDTRVAMVIRYLFQGVTG
jgi:hypothetical protein